jgi:cytochrome P450
MANDSSRASDSAAAIGRSEVDAARNRSFGAGLVDDPYPIYHQLLEQCPVHTGGIAEHFGIPVIDAFADSAQSFTAFGYRSVVDVLRDDRTFSNQWYDRSLNLMIGPNMLGMDAPAHKRQRLLLQSAFSKREMRWWRTDIVQPIVSRAVAEVVPRGAADLYADFAAFIPARVIVEALGLPEHDLAQFFEWAIVMTSSVETPETRAAAAQGMADYISPLCEARRASPTRDLISILVNAVVDDDDIAEGEDIDRHPLSDDEINGFVRLLLVGGTSTTHRAFGMLVYLLLTNPDQLAMLRADRSLAANAIEESLRLEQPLVSWGRLTTRDTELAGVAIAAGCPVNVNVGAANHDPAEWPEPDRFDIARAHPDRHLTFGFGKHHCLGVHLARMELDVMLAAVLDRFPDLTLDATADVGLTGLGFRMVNQLPCTWTVS